MKYAFAILALLGMATAENTPVGDLVAPISETYI